MKCALWAPVRHAVQKFIYLRAFPVCPSKREHLRGTIGRKLETLSLPDVWCHVDKSPDDGLNFSVFVGVLGIICVMSPCAPSSVGSQSFLQTQTLPAGCAFIVLLTGQLASRCQRGFQFTGLHCHWKLQFIRTHMCKAHFQVRDIMTNIS